MRYVGHLDLMRFFQKALRRADIPLAFSQGYHPHPLMSFAAPLSVGVTSCGEYMDIVTEDRILTDKAITAINEQMADGVSVLAISELPEKGPSAMAAVEAASYYVYFKAFHRGAKPSDYDWGLHIRRFYYDASAIPVVKKTKKGEREVDLKPLIYFFAVKNVLEVSHNSEISTPLLPFSEEDRKQFCLTNEDPVFYICASCGSTDNIKPELVMEHLLINLGLSVADCPVGIHRIDMLKRNDHGEFVSLND